MLRGKPEVWDYLGELGVNVRIILKFILQKYDVKFVD
jgi:hypothetical protein